MSKKLGDLNISVVQQICEHLNVEGSGKRNWRDLIAQPPMSYSAFAADGFARNGLHPHTSPADQVLLDFMAQGISVDQLYLMLGRIQAWACRELLEPYVSRQVLESQRLSDGDDPYPPGGGGGVVSSESTPSPDEHPKYGPLPSVAPGPHPSVAMGPHPPVTTGPHPPVQLGPHPPMQSGPHPPIYSGSFPPMPSGPHPPVAPPSSSIILQHGSCQDVNYHGNGYRDNGLHSNGYPEDNSHDNYRSHGYLSGLPHLPAPPPCETVDYQQLTVVGGGRGQMSVAGISQPLNAAVNSAGNTQLLPEPCFYDNQMQPHPLDPRYHGAAQQVLYSDGSGYVPHPPGHVTRTGSDGSTNFNSSSSFSTESEINSSKHSSTDQGSEYTNQGSEYTSSGQGSMYGNHGKGSRYSNSEGDSKYSSSQRSKYSSVPSSDCSTPSELGSKVSFSEAGPNILHFSYAELSEATRGFTEGMVGIGSFGTVFKASVRGNGPYAVKKLHSERELGEHCMLYESFHRETFQLELQLLTRYHHKNILCLVAYSNDGYLPCLVYEFMEHGSLAECLHGKEKIVLRWAERLRIATAVADALHFLHTVNAPKSLVHGDVKCANILLDEHFVPKLSDFGLARELPNQSSRSSSTFSSRSAVVRGTMAYMAPEFVRSRKLTPRTDVYAYGVVLLELHTGLPALSDEHEEPVLTERLYDILEDSDSNRDQVVGVADAKAGWPEEIGMALFDIITVCLHRKMSKRLPMKEVLDQLVTLLPPTATSR